MADRTCLLGDCDRMVHARSWCLTHYRRWRLYGDPAGAAVSGDCSIDECSSRASTAGSGRPLCVRHHYAWHRYGDALATVCSVPDCSRETYCRGWCELHYTRWLRHGDPATRVDTRRDVITYRSAHSRIIRDRGPASEHCCPCGATAAQWAFDWQSTPAERVQRERGLSYSADPGDYIAMCHGCHRRFDA